MKLSKLKGIAYDFASHLDLMTLGNGPFKDLPAKLETNVLEEKDMLDKFCVAFFKERLPKEFNFERIDRIILRISRSMTFFSIKVIVEIEGKEFSSGCHTLMN